MSCTDFVGQTLFCNFRHEIFFTLILLCLKAPTFVIPKGKIFPFEIYIFLTAQLFQIILLFRFTSQAPVSLMIWSLPHEKAVAPKPTYC